MEHRVSLDNGGDLTTNELPTTTTNVATEIDLPPDLSGGLMPQVAAASCDNNNLESIIPMADTSACVIIDSPDSPPDTVETPKDSNDNAPENSPTTTKTTAVQQQQPCHSTTVAVVGSQSEEIATTSAAAIAAREAESGARALVAATPPLECPICLQPCIHPARLPCGHIFCFLCVKGVASKNRRCAMCRREIPVEFLEHPQLVNGIDDIRSTRSTEDGYQWFYEGRNGWWQYDERTSQDIEESFKKGDKSCTILVAGYVYIVDLENMIQQRQNEPARCRRVKRDLATIAKKGVAGLRIEGDIVTAETSFRLSSQEVTFNRIMDASYFRNPNIPLRRMRLNNRLLNGLDDYDDDDEDEDDLNFINFGMPLLDYGIHDHRLDDDDDDDNDNVNFGLHAVRANFSLYSGNNNMHANNSNNSTDPLHHMPRWSSTDAAIRIAGDIIDSTLAHASNGVDAINPQVVGLPNETNASSSNDTPRVVIYNNEQNNGEHARMSNPIINHSTNLDPPVVSTSATSTMRNNNNNNINNNQNNINNNNNNNMNNVNNINNNSNINNDASASVSASVSASGSGSGRTLPTISNNAIVRQNMLAQADEPAVVNYRTSDLIEETLNQYQMLALYNIAESSDENDEATENVHAQAAPQQSNRQRFVRRNIQF